ncbi:hypothetical protein FIBSPDRAFT_148882 [Athelia psychrophila]|uniref:Uncharacterized protein n=1 Tax=Athelia psychrophila TaxID=1759441 RepID=A0A166BPS2_9AGAM|nr:hypothetical protein FIBSPDRAFT_148882 [Fibularhizoctonia sp. CBS 109695]
MATTLPTDTLTVTTPDLTAPSPPQEAAWPPHGSTFYYDGLQDDDYFITYPAPCTTFIPVELSDSELRTREKFYAERAVKTAAREAAAALAATALAAAALAAAPKKQKKQKRKQKKLSTEVSVSLKTDEVQAP